jgi:hypothetical protein
MESGAKPLACFSELIILNGMVGDRQYVYLSIYESFKTAIQQLTIATFAIDFNTRVAKELQSVLLY